MTDNKQIKRLDSFFKKIGEKIPFPSKIYLTGGVAAWFWGGVRPTQDLDFALKTEKAWEEVAQVLQKVSQDESVPVEFTEDISRWGMVGYSDFVKQAKFYGRYGKLRVYVLDYLVWSVGKMSRYTLEDIADVETIFRKQKPLPKKVIRVWAQAFRESPLSTEKGDFIRKVTDFLTQSGPKIWGKGFEPKTWVTCFQKEIEE